MWTMCESWNSALIYFDNFIIRNKYMFYISRNTNLPSEDQSVGAATHCLDCCRELRQSRWRKSVRQSESNRRRNSSENIFSQKIFEDQNISNILWRFMDCFI